jgi:gliding motility-associated lipoprotein GldH
MYDVQIADTISKYNVYLSVRNTPEFENMNLWLFVKSINPNGIITKDTINCILADKRGRWLGSGLGDIYATRHLLKGNVEFACSGDYEVSIKHGMRKLSLEGVSDIGLSIEKIENK